MSYPIKPALLRYSGVSGTRKGPGGASVRDASRVGDDHIPAWEMVEAGRYQPRRIRGSFRGRELG